MAEEKGLQKQDLLSKLENIRFYISTKEQAGEALIFAKKLKQFAGQVEQKVKDRAWEIMDQEEVRKIEAGNFIIKKQEAIDLKEYSPASVVEALGAKTAAEFLKVSAGELERFLTEGNSKGEVSFDTISKCREGMTLKPRKGSIQIKEKLNSK